MPACFYRGLCLLGNSFDIVVVASSHNCSWLVCIPGSIILSTLCGCALLYTSTCEEHLTRRLDLRFSIKGQVRTAEARSVLICRSEKWPIRAEDQWTLFVLKRRCPFSIGVIWCKHFVIIVEIRCMMLSLRSRPFELLLNLNKSNLFGHVFRIPADQVPPLGLFSQASFVERWVSRWSGGRVWKL